MPTFTDAALRRLLPRERPFRVFECGALPGFGLAVSPGGGKTFFVQHTRQGTRRFYRLGSYPALSLAAAREKARQLLAQLEHGIDPRAVPRETPTGSLESLLSAWLAHQRGLGRTWKTMAGGAGLGLDIRNRIQGHALQDVGSRHYDRHSYLEEKRAALLTWDGELRARLAGDNVIPLNRRA